MTRISRRAVRLLIRPLVAFLIVLQAEAAPAANASSAIAGKTDDGLSISIMQSTQGNFGKLGIGVGDVDDGAYLDQKGVRREGLHASLSIAIEGEPSLFQQPDVHEGQTLMVGEYRILIERIIPDGNRGTVVVRIWGPKN